MARLRHAFTDVSSRTCGTELDFYVILRASQGGQLVPGYDFEKRDPEMVYLLSVYLRPTKLKGATMMVILQRCCGHEGEIEVFLLSTS